MDALEILTPLIVAAVATAAATPVVARMARRLRVVDVPSERKVNKRPDIPLLGGIAVAVGVAGGLAASVVFRSGSPVEVDRFTGFFLGGAVLLAIGVWDDRFGMNARPKLIAQIVAAGIAFYSGFRLDFLTEPFTHYTIALPVWLAWALSTFWIVSVTNAVNLIDGLDGLATGLAAIIAITLTIICYQAGQLIGVVLGLALLGASLGFLPFNFPPGRIFLGDNGAYFIGYALSVVALEGYRKAALFTFVVPMMALAVPLLDVVLSVLRRLRSRQRVMEADRFHMHHRLLESEGSPRNAVLSLYFLTTCFCLLAVSFRNVSGYYAVALLIAIAVLTLRLLANLGVFRHEEEVEDG